MRRGKYLSEGFYGRKGAKNTNHWNPDRQIYFCNIFYFLKKILHALGEEYLKGRYELEIFLNHFDYFNKFFNAIVFLFHLSFFLSTFILVMF